MKFLAVFTALVAVACANNTWTLQQLSDAIENPHTDPALKPFLVTALNEMMNAIWAGQQMDAVTVTIPSLDLSAWTLSQLSDAIENPATDPTLIPALHDALNEMMDAIIAGSPVAAAVVPAAPLELQFYTLNELSVALQDPATNPALIPYLENALNKIMDALMAGEQMVAITIAVPAGLLPVEIPAEIIPSPVETEVVAPVNPASPSSPLVQIIVNIKQQQDAPAVPISPVVVPEIIADPVQVVDHPTFEVEPVQIVELAPIEAEPVQVVEAAPEPIQVVEAAPEPIQVVEAAPEPVQVVDTLPVVVNPVQVVVPGIHDF